jgi:23S rRNA (pseudouridine1915-N3)-methyltransferase
MQWKIIVVGKPTLSYAQQGVSEYLPRLQRYTKAEVEYLKETPAPTLEERMLRGAEGCYKIILDERGKSFSTRAFCEKIVNLELQSIRKVALCIGGANGHSQTFRAAADLLLTLSPFTLQHELALVVLLEQLYRAYTLKNGEPYHRD